MVKNGSKLLNTVENGTNWLKMAEFRSLRISEFPSFRKRSGRGAEVEQNGRGRGPC